MISLRMVARVVCAGALGALTACGFARVPFEGGGQPAAQNAPCNPSTGVEGQVRVCPGDTLIGLARRNNVTVQGIMRENGLAGDRILAGQILTMPNEFVHVVQEGDQALTLATRYGVPFEDLVAANDLRPPYALFPEQRLAIPRGGVSTRQAAAPQRLPESQGVTDEAPRTGVTIGRGVTTAPAPQDWQPPQTRQTPGQAAPAVQDDPSAAAAPAGTGSATATAAATPTPRQRPADAPSAPSAPAAAAQKAEPQAPKEPARQTAAARPGGNFLLPVQGRIVSEFGPKSGGLHNDGINIAAPRGTPILASADGEVAYAGDGLPGFGNLILIRHDDGWTSAYAHADSMAVKRGDTVRRGDTIGTVGSTGSVTEPQLHFELRQHDRAVDPKPLVGP